MDGLRDALLMSGLGRDPRACFLSCRYPIIQGSYGVQEWCMGGVDFW